MERRLVRGMALVAVALAPVLGGGCGQSKAQRQAARNVAESRQAAEQGDAMAQDVLGLAYDRGYGVPQDYAAAAQWFQKASEQGYAPAQYKLGLACYKGQGVPPDLVEAYKWITLAAATLKGGAINEVRDDLKSRLTPEQIAEGQKRAAGFAAKKSPAGSK